MRDLLLSKQHELKFVANFHSFGRAIIVPDNANFPSNVPRKHMMIHSFMKEFVNENTFAKNTDIGSAAELIGYTAGGAAGDWII
jgi:hypothetical protein